ncbi:GGACT domain-containing protein [Citrus sinensis]|uniref:GGACT domain-containing protein n=1 Tax=Citrus sinensis TaxID=2711 RepID=A0ACB8NLM8_CITSI|nr:GGACT domain-containing protein [Citrus sinensis]
MGSASASASAVNVVNHNHKHNVFVYGSLLADDVVRVLLKRIPQSSSAILPGYRRFSIKGRVYPAILPVENKHVTGRVLFGISDPELLVLDEFEDFEYQRTTADVSLVDTADKLQVQTYVWTNKNDPNLYGDWDFEEWRRLHMKDFVKMTAGFVEELELPEAKPRVAAYESFYQQNADNSEMS